MVSYKLKFIRQSFKINDIDVIDYTQNGLISIGGCTDLEACNYNSQLIHDDSLCLYNSECDGNIYPGDMNNDGVIDILDLIILVNMILDGEYSAIADLNEDGIINILDIVMYCNIILGV